MLDEKRVKLMTQLAMYEENAGREDFKVSEYYRKDYISMHTISAILAVTIGYACVLALIGLVGFDLIMSKMSSGLIVTLVIAVMIGYFLIMIVYAVIANHMYNEKHKNARQRLKKYNHDLTRLLKTYEKEKR